MKMKRGKISSFASIRNRYAEGRKIKSKQLKKDSERIMDSLQSLMIRAGYSDAPESAREAVRLYAKQATPKMKRIVHAYKRSDDPGGVWIEQGRLDRLQRLQDYRR
jgi:hypothetical protein